MESAVAEILTVDSSVRSMDGGLLLAVLFDCSAGVVQCAVVRKHCGLDFRQAAMTLLKAAGCGSVQGHWKAFALSKVGRRESCAKFVRRWRMVPSLWSVQGVRVVCESEPFSAECWPR
jgi:hypothetical protein